MKPTLNLATRTYINRRGLYLFYGLILAVLTLVLLLNASLYLRSRSETARIEERLAELDRQVRAERGREVEGFSAEAMEALAEDIAYANGILRRDAFRWTVLLGRLEEVLPKEVLISSIQPDYEERSVRLVGVARKVKDLRHCLDKLIASPNFSDVLLLSQERTEAPEGVRYTLVLKGAF